MGSCERLQREHELIGQVLDGVGGLLRSSPRTIDIPMPPFSGALEFFTAFVQRCHEAKEEQALFPVLASYGVPDGDALRTLEGEHDEGRQLLCLLRPLCTRRQMEAEARGLLESYVALQRRHMEFENVSVFPQAERVMSASDEAQVQQGFDRIERDLGGPAGLDVLLALGDALTHACRALCAHARLDASELVARDLIRQRCGTVAPEDSLSRASELMASLGARELPVVERGALVGIVTRADMEPHRGHLEWTPVGAAMSADPITVSPDASIRAVARLLLERGFNSVPVTAEGRLVGMIRRSDLLWLLGEGVLPAAGGKGRPFSPG